VAGYPDPDAAAALREDARVAVVGGLRDPLESLIGDLGGVDVEPPDLTIDDDWWGIAHGA
jgi:hypothetical protein